MQDPFYLPLSANPEIREERDPHIGLSPAWAKRPDSQGLAVRWLDAIHEQMAGGNELHLSMEALHRGLHSLRQGWEDQQWRQFCRESARKHPLREFLHQCPLTRHAFERPRGYAGDAALIDYLYMDRAADELHAGREIYRYLHQQPSAHSVRERRELLAREIDAAAARVPQGARVLSVACGHLREADQSLAVAEGRLAELIAFDQDPLSLAEISRHHPKGIVRPVCGSVRSILAEKTVFRNMDFVYSAGLYDYLAESTAVRLTRLLFDMLRPGGRLIVANFAVHPPETGYMEAFMDWWLIYREEPQMEALVADIPPELIESMHLFRDSQQNVIYLALTRR